MAGTYIPRQLALAALTANAVRPPRAFVTQMPSMVAGWMTSELAPHLLTLTAADALRELSRRRPSRLGLTLAAASGVGLASLVRESLGARQHVDRALEEGLGADYLERLSATYTDLDLSTPLGQLAWPFRFPEHEVEVLRDVPYQESHGRRGLLDVYRQRGEVTGKAPVLVQVHGGAWTIGSKDRQALPLMHHLAARGWLCLAINYRLSPRDPFPAQIVDVKRALVWAREHAHEYGGDPSFLAITGGSAGGHLAALAALTPGDPAYQPGFEDADTSVDAGVAFYGVYDFAGASGSRRAEQLRDWFLGPRVLFADPRERLADFERASPLLRVGPDAPPMMVIHGSRDSMVEVDQARQFARALKERSRRAVVYAELPGTQHAFDSFPSIRSSAVVHGVGRFLRWTYDAAVRTAEQR